MSTATAEGATRRRLGRSVLFILQQGPVINDPVVWADIDTILRTGRAMDLAARLQGQDQSASPALAYQFARLIGCSPRDLHEWLLPVLKQADVIDYRMSSDGTLEYIQDLVGVTGTVIEQAFRVLDALQPSDAEAALLHSLEIGSWAPLTESQHLEQLHLRGMEDQAAEEGLRLSRAIRINRRTWSSKLNEYVVFNPQVWGTRQVDVAAWLKNLPSSERAVLLEIFEQASSRPGIALDQLSAESSMIMGARRVGLVQAATVKSSNGNRRRTYVFSPLIQATDDAVVTSEALHLRKLFVAHILFGVEQTDPRLGSIKEPRVLVQALLDRGYVGPATNIGTDYHMVEAAGVVRVEREPGELPILRLIKREIVEAGQEWLTAGLGGVVAGAEPAGGRQSPGTFLTPERDRASLADDGATDEIMNSAILNLREAAQRAARSDSPFPARW